MGLLQGEYVSNFTIPPKVKSLGGYCYSILSKFVPFYDDNKQMYDIENYQYLKFHKGIFRHSVKYPPHLHRLLYEMMNPRIRWYPKGKFKGYVSTNEVNRIIEEEILQCDRSAYFGQSSETDTYLEYLKRNYPAKKWYRGEKTIFERQVGFAFTVWRESRMVRYFNLFMDSGIYNRISNLITLDATLHREREAKLGQIGKHRYRYASIAQPGRDWREYSNCFYYAFNLLGGVFLSSANRIC